MPGSLGAPEIIAILVVALIVLGPKRLPEAGRQVGKAVAEMRRWSQGFQSEVRSVLDTDPVPDTKPSPSAPSTSSAPAPSTPPATSTSVESSTPPATSTPPADPPTS